MKSKQKIINEINKLHNRYENAFANFENNCYSFDDKDEIELKYVDYLKKNLTPEFLSTLAIEEFFELPLISITKIVPLSELFRHTIIPSTTPIKPKLSLDEIFDVYVNEVAEKLIQKKAEKNKKQAETKEKSYQNKQAKKQNEKQVYIKKLEQDQPLEKQPKLTHELLYKNFMDMLEVNNISISGVQRRFYYGYPKAAKIIEDLIACGAVTKTAGGKYICVNEVEYLNYARNYKDET